MSRIDSQGLSAASYLRHIGRLLNFDAAQQNAEGKEFAAAIVIEAIFIGTSTKKMSFFSVVDNRRGDLSTLQLILAK